MIQAHFQQLLSRRMGLDVSSIGLGALERALQQRIAACGASGPDDYWERVQASEPEFQELVEALVVPETWFFRDAEAFAALVQFLRQNPGGVPRTLRLLSIPCATGEEPYSLAMALLAAGFAPAEFRVDAVDISSRALDQARAARYTRNSFRGTAWESYRHYFEETGTGLGPIALVRQQVTFHQGNLLEPGFMPTLGAFDVVFCRNLLIYFDRPCQDAAIQILGQSLAPSGWLFVGAAETSSLAAHGFVSTRTPMAFAFRKGTPAPPHPAPSRRPKAKPAALRPAHPPIARPHPASAPAKASSPPPPDRAPAARREAELARATQLADEGRLAEAAQLCEAYLRQHPPAAHAYYLLGLVSDASGKPSEAVRLYRKALYLEPAHPEALAHLGLVLERTGDIRGAEVIQLRARRSLGKQPAGGA